MLKYLEILGLQIKEYLKIPEKSFVTFHHGDSLESCHHSNCDPLIKPNGWDGREAPRWTKNHITSLENYEKMGKWFLEAKETI